MKLLTNDERREMLCFFFLRSSQFIGWILRSLLMLAYATRLFIPQYFGLDPIIHGITPGYHPKYEYLPYDHQTIVVAQRFINLFVLKPAY